MQASLAARLYDNPSAWDGLDEQLNLAAGESSILEAYRSALSGAKTAIYIENQHVAHPELLGLLRSAARRGVLVLFVCPAAPMGPVQQAGTLLQLTPAQQAQRWLNEGKSGKMPRYAPVWQELGQLAEEPNFLLCGLLNKQGPIYVHSKLCIVDDELLLVGSANLVDLSLEQDHTELNVCASGDWAPLRRQLFSEHLDLQEPLSLPLRDEFHHFMDVARKNQTRIRYRLGPTAPVFALVPSSYGLEA